MYFIVNVNRFTPDVNIYFVDTVIAAFFLKESQEIWKQELS